MTWHDMTWHMIFNIVTDEDSSTHNHPWSFFLKPTLKWPWLSLFWQMPRSHFMQQRGTNGFMSFTHPSLSAEMLGEVARTRCLALPLVGDFSELRGLRSHFPLWIWCLHHFRDQGNKTELQLTPICLRPSLSYCSLYPWYVGLTLTL